MAKPSGPVAQRLEQGTHNPLAAGSNPAGPTTCVNCLARVERFEKISGSGHSLRMSEHGHSLRDRASFSLPQSSRSFENKFAESSGQPSQALVQAVCMPALSLVAIDLSDESRDIALMDLEPRPAVCGEVADVTRSWLERQDSLAAKISDLDPSLVAQAIECFESAEDAGRFLITPARYLGGQTPVEAAQTPDGIHHVRELLNAIEHGVYL
jgi:hypothetical protein